MVKNTDHVKYDGHYMEYMGRQKKTSSSTTLDIYDLKLSLPTRGTCTIHWEGEDGENYIASVKVRQEVEPMYRDPLWLLENYYEKERTMAEIADEFGITPTAVNQWLNKHDIPTRNRGHSRRELDEN